MPQFTCLCAHLSDVHERPGEPLPVTPGEAWSWYPANRCAVPSCGCMCLRVTLPIYAALAASSLGPVGEQR